MKIVFGLGNPGGKYENTRHNAGFYFLDRLRESLGYDQFYEVDNWTNDKYLKADLCWAKGGVDKKVLMVKPVTFMNKSGISARAIQERFKPDFDSEFVLVHDDLDLELGSYKLQKSKSPKRHNGVISVESYLGLSRFSRLRIGVDSRNGSRAVAPEDYVLTKFSKEEKEDLNEAMVDALLNLRKSFVF